MEIQLTEAYLTFSSKSIQNLRKLLSAKLFVISNSFHPYFISNFRSTRMYLLSQPKFGGIQISFEPFELFWTGFKPSLNRTPGTVLVRPACWHPAAALPHFSLSLPHPVVDTGPPNLPRSCLSVASTPCHARTAFPCSRPAPALPSRHAPPATIGAARSCHICAVTAHIIDCL
jgi:hypothetical protein